MHHQQIPEEIITDILSSLPVKSLARFKLVEKSWNSLISDILSGRSAANPHLLFASSKPPFIVSSLPMKSLLKTPPPSTDESQLICTLESHHKIIGSCNGLVCLLATRSYRSVKEYRVCFLNPTTKSMSRDSPHITFKHPDRASDSYGFGYDHVSDTYKVVLSPNYVGGVNQRMKIFTMGGTDWRDIEFFSGILHNNCNRVGVHLNGSLNWLASREPTYIDMCGWQGEIISVDLNKEKCVELSLPYMTNKSGFKNLGILDECLCVCHDNTRNQNFVIWQMKEFGVYGSWTKLLNICYGDLQPRVHFFSPWFPTSIFDNGDLLILRKRLIYNHRDHRLDPLTIPHIIGSDVLNLMIYSESLISP